MNVDEVCTLVPFKEEHKNIHHEGGERGNNSDEEEEDDGHLGGG